MFIAGLFTLLSSDVLNEEASLLCVRVCNFSILVTQKYASVLRCDAVSTVNTLWTGDADLRLCITTVEDG